MVRKTPVNVEKGKKGFQRTPPKVLLAPEVPLLPEIAQLVKQETLSYEDAIRKYENCNKTFRVYYQIGDDSRKPSSYIMEEKQHERFEKVNLQPGWLTEEEYWNRINTPVVDVERLTRFERLFHINGLIKTLKRKSKIFNTLQVAAIGLGTGAFGYVFTQIPENWWNVIPFIMVAEVFRILTRRYSKKIDEDLQNAEQQGKDILKQVKKYENDENSCGSSNNT